MLLAPVQRLEYDQDLPLTLEQAWDFFSRPENLASITPPELAFEVISPLPQRMYAGMIVSYRIQPFPGVVVPWTTEITHVREPFFFVDEQRTGPYRFWHHQHQFVPVGQGVRMTDLVHYQVGWGVAGHWIAGAMVRRRLEAIFTFRRQRLGEMFAAVPPS